MFVNKEIDFNDFMKQLCQRIQKGGNAGALIFFECFLQEELPRELKRQAVPGWDGRVNAGDFDNIYPMAANILHDAASRNYSECHLDIFKEASAVSSAFCEEVNEIFQCSGDDRFGFIPIKSYTEMMAEAGLVNLTRGPGGQTMVSLSEKGESVAREVKQEIERAQD